MGKIYFELKNYDIVSKKRWYVNCYGPPYKMGFILLADVVRPKADFVLGGMLYG